MAKEQWTAFDWLQHKMIHALYDLLVWAHDHLIEYACSKNLWRTPEERANDEPPEQS
jgi:hypothetical protein